jgi:hypothetical protein
MRKGENCLVFSFLFLVRESNGKANNNSFLKISVTKNKAKIN